MRLSESQVTVVSPDVGGGFGQKIALYREELTVCARERQLRRPVRWREDRMENLLASSHAREDSCRTRAAVTKEGRLLGLELEILEDFGAYCFYPANYLARVVAMILTGPYKVRDYAFDVKVVLTNKCGNGPMRAPMAITSWLIEGTMDAIARELELDPLEVRRVNMVRGARASLQHGDRRGASPTSRRARPWKQRSARSTTSASATRQAAARRAGRYLGLGFCTVVESTTYGSTFYKAAGIPGSGHEAAWLRIEPSGAVNASVGLGASGQGYETALRRRSWPTASASIPPRCGCTWATPTSRPTAWAAAARAAAPPADGTLYLVRADATREGAGHRREHARLRRPPRACTSSTAAWSARSSANG